MSNTLVTKMYQGEEYGVVLFKTAIQLAEQATNKGRNLGLGNGQDALRHLLTVVEPCRGARLTARFEAHLGGGR